MHLTGLVKGNWRIKKGTRGGKKSKKADESPLKSPPQADATAAAAVPTQMTSPPAVKPAEKTASSANDVNWSHYAPFFRELDMSAFKILSYDTVKIGSKVKFTYCDLKCTRHKNQCYLDIVHNSTENVCAVPPEIAKFSSTQFG